MTAIIIDTETTGVKDPQATEIAYLGIKDLSLEVTEEFEQRYKPTKPIELGAMVATNICMEDLVDCPPPSTFNLPKVDYLIGHNIDYDWKVIGKPDIPRIDTLPIARTLLPDIDSHTQSALLYYYEGIAARDKLKNAHSALADVRNCRLVLAYLLEEYHKQANYKISSLAELYLYSEECRVPTKMPFGKHKGELVKDIPTSYKSWLLKQPELDKYLKTALEKRI